MDFLTDHKHKIAFLDLNLIYATQLPLQLQLYSGGVVRYFNTIEPSSAYEYTLGVVHVDLDTYRRLFTEHPWARAITGSVSDQQAFATSLRRSIWSLARRNVRFEATNCTAKCECAMLLDACWDVMQYALFDPEEMLAPLVAAHLTKLGLDADAWMPEFSEPAVTPYLVVIQQEACRYWAQPGPETLRTFIRRAAFLRDPQIVLDGWWHDRPAVHDYLETLGALSCPEAVHGERRQRRSQQLTQFKSAISSRQEEHQTAICSLIGLYGTLIDHEEARHYWQGRTLRNITEFALHWNIDPIQATAQDLLSIL